MTARLTVVLILFLLPLLATANTPSVRRVVTAGQPAPGGGTFERFSVESLPIVAPVNSKGQVAFFATVLRGAAPEGIFLASRERIVKVAAEGDSAPGGGTLSGLGRHPVPALNEVGAVVFAAAVAGGRTVEGIFLAHNGRLRAVAVVGSIAPGIPSGTFASLDAPALNDRGDVVFLSTARRGRETVEAIHVSLDGRARKIVAQGDDAPAGGQFAAFGPPAINARGEVAFAAVVEGRAVPGGIFVAGRDRPTMLVGAGDRTPVGGIFAKFSERVTLNETGAVAFTAVIKDAPAAQAIFVVNKGGARKVVALGEAAEGGGVYSNFSLWPALGRADAIAFVASIDGGPSPLAVFVAEAARVTRLVSVGDSLPDQTRVATLGLYPVVAMSRAGGLTFSTARTPTGEGADGIFFVSLPSP